MGNAPGSPLACGCGQDLDDATNDLLQHFKCKNIKDAKPSPLPQLVTGRVCPASHNLKSPVTGRSVVYYFLDVQQQEEEQQKDQGGRWKPAFQEAGTTDFVLADPLYPDDCVAVISKSDPRNVRMYSTLEGKYLSADDAWTVSNLKGAPGLKEAAARQHFDVGGTGLFSFASSSGGAKTLRHFEATFEVNMQVAVLGVITSRAGPDGASMMFLKPCTVDTLTDDYFNQYGWAEHARSAWRAIFEKGPAVCVTDDPEHFGGVVVEAFDDSDLPSVISV